MQNYEIMRFFTFLDFQNNAGFGLRGPTLGRKVESIRYLCVNLCLDSPKKWYWKELCPLFYPKTSNSHT